MAQTKWTVYSNNPVPDSESIGVAQLQKRQIISVNSQHSDIRFGVCADNFGLELPLVCKLNLDCFSPLDNVPGCEDMTIFGNNKATAFAALVRFGLRKTQWRFLWAEEIVITIIITVKRPALTEVAGPAKVTRVRLNKRPVRHFEVIRGCTLFDQNLHYRRSGLLGDLGKDLAYFPKRFDPAVSLAKKPTAG